LLIFYQLTILFHKQAFVNELIKAKKGEKRASGFPEAPFHSLLFFTESRAMASRIKMPMAVLIKTESSSFSTGKILSVNTPLPCYFPIAIEDALIGAACRLPALTRSD